MVDLEQLVARYVAVWNEPDPEVRRKSVAELWSEHAVHTVQPPQELLAAASVNGLALAMEAKGHDEMELRVRRAYEQFVGPGTHTFQPGTPPVRLRDLVRFGWQMVTSDGAVAGHGTQVVVLGNDGRIDADYQFIDG